MSVLTHPLTAEALLAMSALAGRGKLLDGEWIRIFTVKDRLNASDVFGDWSIEVGKLFQ